MLRLDHCLKLEELPEIEDTMDNLKVLSLDNTAIKELPSSLHRLVGLEELSLRGCRKLKTIPSSIGRLSSLTQISLQGSNIVNLPESMVHLSSLKSLNLSDCKSLECIPKLPPYLKELLAFDCTSIKKVVPNSLLSDSNDEMDGSYEFRLTNSDDLDSSSWSYIVNKAWIKITDDACLSALFCFPGSRVPDCFLHRGQGHSITVKNNDEYVCSENRLIGFALCVVLGSEDMYESRIIGSSIPYNLRFKSNGKQYLFQNKLKCKREDWFIRDHTYLWKYRLNRTRIGKKLIHAQNITFETLAKYSWLSEYRLNVTVKECGIRPLYITKEPNASKAAQ